MPLRNQTAVCVKPKGCSDAVDASNAFPGAMRQLANLVASSSNDEMFELRPAAIGITALPGIDTPGFQSGHLVVGDVEYGMIASALTPGFDQPYAYNLETNTLLTVSGITSANVPTSPPSTGDWTPPILAQVGERIVVTHPGFPDGPFLAPLVDMASANTYSGTDIIDGYLPNANNYAVGALISGTGISAGTVLISVAPIHQTPTATGTAGTNHVTVSSAAGLVVGLQVTIPSIGFVSFIASISGTTITFGTTPADFLPANITAAATSFVGNAMTVSHNSTASTTAGETITVNSPGQIGIKFGWFDISSLSVVLSGSTVQGSPIITVSTDLGLQPGLVVSGIGIPSGAFIEQISNPTIPAFEGITQDADSTVFTAIIVYPAGTAMPTPIVGQTITGPNVSPGMLVQSASLIWAGPAAPGSGGANVATWAIVMSQNAIAGGTGLYSLSGVFAISLSAPATATGAVDFTFTGGTPTAPQWGAGDTSINPLPSVPVGVAQFNGRAYFACGIDGIAFSDSLLPCIRTNASQALIPGDGLAIVALGSLPLTAPLTGGIVQAIIAFAAGSSRMYQITGDPVTNNLSLQAMNVATGTESPLSITPTNFGLTFMSPDGLRVVDFSGAVSNPIGDHGSGIAVPFINAVYPSRMCIAATADVIRISVLMQTRAMLEGGLAPRQQEWWLDITRKIWTGPHTFPVSLIQPWRNTFVVTPAPGTPIVMGYKLFRSDAELNSSTTFVENGAVLSWAYQPVLLPDNRTMFMNDMNEAMLTAAIPGGEVVNVYAVNEAGELLDHVTITGTALPAAIWGTSIWNQFLWDFPGGAFLRQWSLLWTKGIVFKQVSILVTGRSVAGYALGNLNLRYQRTGYQMQAVPANAAA